MVEVEVNRVSSCPLIGRGLEVVVGEVVWIEADVGPSVVSGVNGEDV